MNKRAFSRYTAVGAGILQFLGGLAHTAFGLPELHDSVSKGEISPEAAGGLTVEWVFSGMAMCLLGIWIMELSTELWMGKRRAWRQGLILGISLILFGSGAFYYRFPDPHLLVFAVIGLMLCGPLLVWPREFLEK